MDPASMPHRDQAFRDQPSLFDQPASPIVPPAAPASPAPPADQGEQSRNETYREVRETHDLQRSKWLMRIIAAGRSGVTLDELSARHGVPPNTFSGRITELRDLGLVVRTGERRPTRAGSTAAVIVATQFFNADASAPQPALTNQEQAAMSADVMPDQLTNTATPRDTQGRPLVPGRCYRVARLSGGSVRVEVYEDEQGNLCCCAAGTDHVQRIDEMDPRTRWTRA